MRKEVREGVRKVRSDKKKDIKPIVPVEIYDLVGDLSYVTRLPRKDICEYFCIEGFKTKQVMENIAHYFKRDFVCANTLYRGNSSLTHSRHLKVHGDKMRLSIRFSQDFSEAMDQLSYCMNLTPASACRLLLEGALLDITIVDRFLKEYTSSFDEDRKKVLKKVLKYIKRHSPYPHDELSLAEILKELYGEVKGMFIGSSHN